MYKNTFWKKESIVSFQFFVTYIHIKELVKNCLDFTVIDIKKAVSFHIFFLKENYLVSIKGNNINNAFFQMFEYSAMRYLKSSQMQISFSKVNFRTPPKEITYLKIQNFVIK